MNSVSKKSEKKHSILAIDDEPMHLSILVSILGNTYQMYTTECTEDALSILEKEHINVVISDYNMTKITGVQFLQKVMEKFPDVGRILLTANSEKSSIMQDAFNRGIIDKFVHKGEDVSRFMGTVQDVITESDKKFLERQLTESSKMASLGELAAGVAHEINNPLSFIYANLGNLSKFTKKIMSLVESYDNLDLPEEIKKEIADKKEEIHFTYLQSRISEMIDRSVVGAERMRKIVMDLKTFSRVDAAEVAHANINESLDTTLGIMTHEYKDRVVIEKEYESELPQVECYISKVNQVFLNVLVNACHAIEGKGVIKVRTGVEDDYVVVVIEDSGCGMPDNVKEKIFNPFFTTKPVGSGTGLGLSISYKIIKNHNGEICVDSEVGKGTKFTIKIPIRSQMTM